ncbi:Alcohol dehydrogenase zinc-binding domain protein [Thermaerobacter marianensis DSM 12885]|uniref:Alcohol dehydrogenase zinc-binding domain protein n=1 Tax=Thermaerobacter marianensis (strain ATCC 700841 / DSM 12885 / JCM 10246 / 7p75a) TaxID=644966 RepID=E6SHN3_THEM7|nr:zinc-dependent alcohol dehydrogenase family protein [Thermaerobacter marianensis]ADU51828.1 Alcohol dehydrogenase zinc-binding domain protein [Thermaerobacter marianensis DSM 12885]
MLAAQIVAFQQPLRVERVPDPTPGPADAVIRVAAEGICRSDWHAWMGDWSWIGLSPALPIIPGHEFSGTVEAVGREVRRLRPGDRVTVPFHEACGHCSYCLGGVPNLCDAVQIYGITQNGGYAEYVLVRNADFNCIKLPDAVDFLTAAAIGCRYMTAFHGVTKQGDVRPGQWVVVHGCGGVGLSAVQIAAAMGAQVIAVDVSEQKLAKARDEGAVATVDARHENVPQAVKDLTRGGADVSIDALGIRDTVRNSVLCLRKGGRHVQIGLTTSQERGEVELPVDVIVAQELQIYGSLGNPHPDYRALLALVERGVLKPASLVSRTVRLEEASDVLHQMTEFGTLGFHVITEF